MVVYVLSELRTSTVMAEVEPETRHLALIPSSSKTFFSLGLVRISRSLRVVKVLSFHSDTNDLRLQVKGGLEFAYLATFRIIFHIS